MEDIRVNDDGALANIEMEITIIIYINVTSATKLFFAVK